MRALLDLILPMECGGCGVPGTVFCKECTNFFSGGPFLCETRHDPGVPVWALAEYQGAARELIINVKERARGDLTAVAGYFVAQAIVQLRIAGELDREQIAPLVLIPAPSRWLAARARGGDPIRTLTKRAVQALPDVHARTHAALRLTAGVRDSVGLSAAQRRRNVAGHVRVRRGSGAALRSTLGGSSPPAVVVVDDVVTTGALLTESVHVLQAAGARVCAAITVAAA